MEKEIKYKDVDFKTASEAFDSSALEVIGKELNKIVCRFGFDTEFHLGVKRGWQGERGYIDGVSESIPMTPRLFEKLFLIVESTVKEREDENPSDDMKVFKIHFNIDWRWQSFNGGENGTRCVSCTLLYNTAYKSVNVRECTF